MTLSRERENKTGFSVSHFDKVWQSDWWRTNEISAGPIHLYRSGCWEKCSNGSHFIFDRLELWCHFPIRLWNDLSLHERSAHALKDGISSFSCLHYSQDLGSIIRSALSWKISCKAVILKWEGLCRDKKYEDENQIVLHFTHWRTQSDPPQEKLS